MHMISASRVARSQTSGSYLVAVKGISEGDVRGNKAEFSVVPFL
jgi:hypothetical protein